MQSSLQRTSLAIVATIGLSLFAEACSVNPVIFTGTDADVPPGTAILTVARNGTSTGTVSSNPAGLSCGATCSAVLPLGTIVTLTATPDTGAEFAGWSGGGCTGATPTCTVTVGASTAVTATFDIARYLVTINLGGSGAGMVVAPSAGITCPGSCTSMVLYGSQLSLAASPDGSSQFMGWTVGPGGTACTGTGACSTTITGPTTITATFARYQSLEVTRSGTGNGTVTSTPAGITCGTDCSETYPPGAAVTLTAAAAGDSTFVGWSGGCSGTGPCNVVVNSALMVTADFAVRKYDLTVTKAGLGAGTVTSTPAGIDCGATCTATYDAGTQVTLTASPAVGSLFAGWSGGGCTGTGTCVVTMAAATTVTADFSLAPFSLTVTKAGTGTGTVTSSPAGITCGTDCTEPYPNGTMVTLTAVASTGSTFTGWSGGGCAGTGTCVVTITAAINVTATFTLNTYALSVTKAGTGAGTVTSLPAGINCGATCSATFSHGTAITLTPTPTVGSTFTGWSGGGCSGTGACIVTLTAPTAVTATFTLNTYTLSVTLGASTGSGSVSSVPAGITCGTDCSEVYDHGTPVTLTATPNTGSTFSGWSGACASAGTSPSCTVTMTAATVVTATFAINTYTFSITKVGTGSGTVSSSPAGINCGATCSEVVNHGTTITLTASPATGSTFSGWSGSGCTGTSTCVVTVIAATTVTASFTLNSYTFSVTRSGNGNGTVTSSPAGINCGATCSEVVDHGTTVTLTASPATGSTFTGWSGGGCSSTGTCTVTVIAATAVTATFTLNTYTLSVTKSGTGSGTVTSAPAGINCGATCSQSVSHGATVTFTATPVVGSAFTGWSGGGCSGTGTCTVTLTANTTVTANFTADASYTVSVSIVDMQRIRSFDGSRITSLDGNIDCDEFGAGTCSATYTQGSTITLTLEEGFSSAFDHWSGACAGQGAFCSLTITADTSTVGVTRCVGLCP